MELKQLTSQHLKMVENFYQDQINLLERKEFFYPFAEGDLAALLGGGGYACGAFMDDTLVGISCVDRDPDYGKLLLENINVFKQHLPSNAKIYEYSGVMTDSRYRRNNIAATIYNHLLKYSQQNLSDGYLCAVIQLDNAASLTFFYSRGFRLLGAKKVHDIDFGFLVRPISSMPFPIMDAAVTIPSTDYEQYRKLIGLGYMGTGYNNSMMVLARSATITE